MSHQQFSNNARPSRAAIAVATRDIEARYRMLVMALLPAAAILAAAAAVLGGIHIA